MMQARSTAGNNSSTTQQEFFVVQRCCFDGLLIDSEHPVDYLALFTRRKDADNVAYQSAHAFAAEHHAVVRTLLLPTSGYAFSTAGKLFWVRSVYAPLPPLLQPQHSQTEAPTITNHGAHVILTRGAVGGRGGRRGTEVSVNRVFVGADSSNEALHVLNQGDMPPGSMISWIPFGPLPARDMRQGWSSERDQTMIMENDTDPTTAKRPVMEGQQQQFHYHATAVRPAKRHRDDTSFTMDMCT